MKAEGRRQKTDDGRQKTDGGFTLIEVMVVIVIIMILAGIVVAAAKYAQTKAARSHAQAEIAAMETALESFKSDNGYYPASSAFRNNAGTNSYMLVRALSGAQTIPCVGNSQGKVYFEFKRDELKVVSVDTYLCTNIIPCLPPPCVIVTNITIFIVTNYFVADPFGMPYDYYNNPGAVDQTNSVTFDLWSYGPDGRNDTADDIVNWRQ